MRLRSTVSSAVLTALVVTVLSGPTAGAATAPPPIPTPSPTYTAPCPDPVAPPGGVTATATLVAPAEVQVRLTWTPLVLPAHCGSGVVEIEQVTPPGATVRAPSADGATTITGLSPSTAYTWRLRYVAGTVGLWATVSIDPAPAATPTCTAIARVESAWAGGLIVTVSVRNTSPGRLRSWTAGWTLPEGVRIQNVWNATGTTSGSAFTATSAAWNASLTPGSSTSFGFYATRSGTASIAPAFTCTGTPST